MYDAPRIIHYPDPRLRKPSATVTTFDQALKDLAARMLELMREAKGVGLAAPQVGHNLRLFVMNATGEPGDDRAYVNPDLIDGEGTEEGEEGCLSIPGVNVKILRDKKLRMRAHDLDGKPIDESAIGFVARVWQHETDHLNGTLITDRMGAVAKMAYKKKLKELEEEFAKKPK
jgi:peptide deformylase